VTEPKTANQAQAANPNPNVVTVHGVNRVMGANSDTSHVLCRVGGGTVGVAVAAAGMS